MTDFNQKTHDTDVGSHGGQSRQMMEVFENQEFGSIRVLQEAGKTFFCASDVAKALGYVNPYAAVKRHCRGPLTKREGVVQKVNQYGDAGEQVVEIAFITEGDVYRLIVHSKLPSAERFEHWVFDEVLPSIRKHTNGCKPINLYSGCVSSMQIKIIRAKDAIASQRPRIVRCPYCRHNSIIVFEDTRGHVQTKCKACGRETVFNVLEMRRLRRLQLYHSSLNG